MSLLTQADVDERVDRAIAYAFPFGKPAYNRKVYAELVVSIRREFTGDLAKYLLPMIRTRLRAAGYGEWTGGFDASLRS